VDVPEKTRIAFQVRMSFAACTLRRRCVDGHVVLARWLEEAYSAGEQRHLKRRAQASGSDS
jgi:hypothetical protein